MGTQDHRILIGAEISGAAVLPVAYRVFLGGRPRMSNVKKEVEKNPAFPYVSPFITKKQTKGTKLAVLHRASIWKGSEQLTITDRQP